MDYKEKKIKKILKEEVFYGVKIKVNFTNVEEGEEATYYKGIITIINEGTEIPFSVKVFPSNLAHIYMGNLHLVADLTKGKII